MNEIDERLEHFSVTKFNVQVINIVVCYVCVIYTMLGGIKAVVWTDVSFIRKKKISFNLNVFHGIILWINRCYKQRS